MRTKVRGLGVVYQRPNSAFWWIAYTWAGKRVRESAGTTERKEAIDLLKKRHGEMSVGRVVTPDVKRVALRELVQLLMHDYDLKGNTSKVRAGQALAHVVKHFGEGCRAVTITAPALDAYAVKRMHDAKPATVKNELALLRRAFNLAVRKRLLLERPAFPTIGLDNIRKGFFEEDAFRAVAARLPEEVRTLVTFLFLTGWRRGEAIGLLWSNVDLQAGVLRIEDSKNREPRTLPFRALPELDALIRSQREKTTALERRWARIIPYVFHRDGHRIGAFRKTWASACKAAGAPGRLVHDLRRSAARNLSRAGVPKRVVMQLCGWKTRSVFDRYRIVSERDLAEGLAKLGRVGVAGRV
jgi:integrase